MQQGGLLCSHSTSEGVKGLTEGAGLFPAGFLSAYHLLLTHGESGPGCGWAAGLNIQLKAAPSLR